MAIEQFINSASTTLSAGLAAGALSCTVTSGAVFPAAGNFRIKIGTELIIVGARSGNTLSSLTRGAEGTVDAAHSSSDPVVFQVTAASLQGVTGWHNPRAYGAKGDGTTDDSTAIAAAKAAAGVGGVVYFPQGTYLTGALVLDTASQTWIIESGATLKLKNSVNSNLLEVTAADVAIEGGGTIDQNKANQTDGAAIFLNGATRAIVRDLIVTNAKGLAAIALSGASHNQILNNRITNSAQHAIFGFGNSKNNLVDGNRITDGPTTGGNHGISFHSNTGGQAVSGNRVTNNYIEIGAADGFGVEIGAFGGDNPRDCLVEHNLIIAVGQCEGGVSFATMDQSIMSGNIFDGAGLTIDNCAFELAIANDCIVQGNLARGCDAARIGYSVDQSNRCVVQGNFLRGWANTTSGMHIASSSASVDASDNVISGNVLIAVAGNTVPAIWVQANAAGVNCDRNAIVGNVLVGVSSATGILLQIDTGTIDATIIVANSFSSWTTKINVGSATNTVNANNN